MLRLVPPDAALLHRAAPFVRLLAEASAGLGVRLEMDADYAFVGRLTAADGRQAPIFGKSLGLNGDAAAHLAADKDYTARWLAAAGLPSPPGQLVFSDSYRSTMALKNADVARRLPGPETARDAARRFGYPVVIKPNTGSEGRGIRFATTPEELDIDIARALADDDILRVEPRLGGCDHRVLVLDGRVTLAYARLPLSVTGDGESPLATLIARALHRLETRHRGAKLAANDPRLLRRLAADGLTAASILPEGREQRLLDNANLSTGGRLKDLTSRLSPEAKALALDAAASLGLTVAGIDMLAPDLSESADNACILEVNSAPGIDYYATATPENWKRARAVVIDMLKLRLERKASPAPA